MRRTLSQANGRGAGRAGAVIRWACRGLCGVGLLWLAVTLTPVDRVWTRMLSRPWSDGKGEILVVLGGSVLDDGTIGDSSYWRSVYAARAWQHGDFREMWISGQRPISSAMRDFVVYRGVPASVIQLEERSTSTRENALFMAEILRSRKGRIVLLTSDYHIFRARRAFARAGVEAAPWPVPDAGKRELRARHRWTVFQELLVETAKVVYYKIRGWI